jgi:hypothetical protein
VLPNLTAASEFEYAPNKENFFKPYRIRRFMSKSRLYAFSLSLLLVIAVTLVFSSFTLPTYAQTPSSSPNSSMKKTTSGGALDVVLQPSPEPIGHTGPTSFKVSFLQKGTDKVQPHIDYDFTIANNGKQVFQASQLAGQPGQPLHTAEGAVTIPYKFQVPGDYSINISLYGILFNPIKPESADFSVKVS